VQRNIGTFLIPAATLILPGCAQLLQGRFTVGLRHVAMAVLLSNIAFFLPDHRGGIVAAILWLAIGGWSAFDAWRWERDDAPPQTVTTASPPVPGPPQPWYRRHLPFAVLGVLQVAAAGEIMLLGLMAAFAVMIFDAPGSTEKIENWAFFIGVSLLPVAAMVLCAVAWGLSRRGRPWWAVATLAGVVLAGLLIIASIIGPDAFQ
jgi:hypothetical protein